MARPTNPFSLRSYAKHRGVSLAAVQGAVKAQRITAKNGEIRDFKKADIEWDNNTTTTKVRKNRSQAKRGLNQVEAMEEAALNAEKPGSNIKTTPAKKKAPKAAPKTSKKTKTQKESPASLTEEGPRDSSPSPSGLIVAKTANETYKAKLAKLDFEKKAGALISLEAARAAFFQVASNARERILSIPDRVSELLAAKTDPHEIREELEKELREALTEISAEAPLI